MLHVYFDEAKLVAAGAIVETNRIGKRGEEYDKKICNFERHSLSYSDGRPYEIKGDSIETYELPKELVPFVVEVTYYDNFGYGLQPHRQQGPYRLASALAELKVVGGKDCHYHSQLRGKTVEDVRELNSLIREGKIWPKKDYEAPQMPPPARHLRQLCSEAWILICREVSDCIHRVRERVTG